jgi:hypothetical protein
MTSIGRGVMVALFAGALCGCGVQDAAAGAGECVGAGIGRALGSGMGASFQEQLGPFGDWAVEGAPGSGVTLSVSARHKGGRLFLAFEGPAADGALPRFPTPGDCVHQDTRRAVPGLRRRHAERRLAAGRRNRGRDTDRPGADALRRDHCSPA